MKTLILTLALLPLSLFATEFSSEPIQLDGNYVFSGVKTGLVRDTELVPSMNTKRFNELVADKYDCYLRGDFFYCQKFMHGTEMPADLKNEMIITWNERFIAFIASGFAPTLTNESDLLMEWDINDSVRFEGFPASEYHYYLIRSQTDIHKISINFADAQRWFVISDEDHISTSVERTVRINNLKARIYSIDVEFTRKP